jgi:hypothetical protein
VPFRLRCQLLGGNATLWGSIIFGFTSVLAVALASGMDPVGSLLLAWSRQEAPGQVLSERDTNYEEDDCTVRRHDYEFRLPDGRLLRGHCYSDGHKYLNVPVAAGAPDPQRWARVTVEYFPVHPATSRIKGMRTHAVSHWVAFTLLFPFGALLAVLVGLVGGWCHIRLLRQGELAEATVTGCKRPSNEDAPPDVPLAECRRLLAEQAVRAAGSAFAFLWNLVISAWCLAVLVMIVGGVVFVVFGMVKVALGDESFSVNGQTARGPEGVLSLAGFLAAWLCIGGVMLAGGNWLRRAPRMGFRSVDCAYEFRTPGGEVVRARESVPVEVLDECEAPLPVLYNPNRSGDTMLLATVSPPVRLSDEGHWQATVGLGPLLRLAVATVALVGGPLLGLALAVG